MKKTVLPKIRSFFLDFIIFSVPVGICFLIFPYIIKLFIPFIAGSVIYFIARPINNFFKKRLPDSLSAFLSLVTTASAVIFIIWEILGKLLKELSGFAEKLSAFYSSPENSFPDLFENISSYGRRFSADFLSVPDLTLFSESFGNVFKEWIARIISGVSGFLLGFAKNIPSFMLIIFISFFTAFFMLKENNSFSSSFISTFGEKAYKNFIKIKNTLFSVLGKYLKALFLIELIIFGVLFLGFSVLQVDYVLLFATITAVVDAIPVLGTGTILIPWSLFSFASKNFTLGWGLLSLYGVCLLTRQLCEPKIIGKKLGIHPLLTIFSIYIGLRVFGFFGILIGPVITLFIKSITSAYVSRET